MGFRVLGPVELWAGERRIDLGTGKQRAVLAILLLAAGRPCSVESMIDRVWGENPPPRVRNALYSYVSRLRRALKDAGAVDAALLQRNGGYLLDVPAESVDIHQFEALLSEARTAGTTESRAKSLGEALDVWSGTPLQDVPGRWANEMRETLCRKRIRAAADWGAAMVELGRHDEAVELLEREFAEHPNAELIAEQLIRALQRQGRLADALARYAALRERLADDLGIGPGLALRELHMELLRADEPRVVPRPIEPAVAEVRRVRSRRPIALAVLICLVVTGILAHIITLSASGPDRELETRLIASAREQLSVDPELAVILAEAAVRIGQTQEAQAILAQALTESRVRQAGHGEEGPVKAMDVHDVFVASVG